MGTSLTSNGDREVYGPYYGPMIKYNPHIKFFDGDRRGYVRARLTPQRFTADLQMVKTVSRRDAEQYTYASFESAMAPPEPSRPEGHADNASGPFRS